MPKVSSDSKKVQFGKRKKGKAKKSQPKKGRKESEYRGQGR